MIDTYVEATGRRVYHAVDPIPDPEWGLMELCSQRPIVGPAYTPEHGNEAAAPSWFRRLRLCRRCAAEMYLATR